jgi:hypothetical protein
MTAVLAFRARASVSTSSQACLTRRPLLLYGLNAEVVRLTPRPAIVAARQIERPVVGRKPRFAPNAVVCQIAVSSDGMAAA